MQGRKRGFTTLIGLVSAVAVATVLGACGTHESGGKSKASGHKTISWWSEFNVGEPMQKIFAGMVADYEKATGVTVNVRWLGRNSGDAVKNAAAVGKAPDIYELASDHLGDFRAHGLVSAADLSAVMNTVIPGEGKKVKDVLPPAVLKSSSDAAGLAQLPFVLATSGIWFDAATHPEWVTNPPATFDDLLATAEKIKSTTSRAPLAQDGTVDGYNAYWIYWLLMRHGGPGTLSALGKSASNWDQAPVLAAAKDVEKLVKAHLFEPDYMATKYPAAQNQWADRKHDLIVNGSWLHSETGPNEAPGFKAQMFQFPLVPGGSNSVELGAQGFGVNPKTHDLPAVKSFLAFVMQKKYMSEIATTGLAPRADVPAPPSLVGAQKAIADASSIQATDDSAPSVYAGWWNDVFLPLDDKLIAGKITAEQFVQMGKSQTAGYHG